MITIQDEVVYAGDLMRSNDVHANHDHKLWWGDIIKSPTGSYIVTTYAQIVRIGQPADVPKRFDREKTFSSFDDAKALVVKLYNHKILKRGYYPVGSRSNQSTPRALSQEEINQFLRKYESIISDTGNSIS